MGDVFIETLLKDKVNIRPRDLDGDYKLGILTSLRDRYEGKCSHHGYVRRHSIKIHKIGMGNVQMASLNGDVSFVVEYFADLCLPIMGVIIKATVKNMNTFGVLCDVTRDNDVVIEIIVTKKSAKIKSEVNLENVKIGDIVNVEVLGRKFELNDKKISIIGRIVVNAKPNKMIVHRAQQPLVLNDDNNYDEEVASETIGELEEEDEEDDQEENEKSEEEDIDSLSSDPSDGDDSSTDPED